MDGEGREKDRRKIIRESQPLSTYPTSLSNSLSPEARYARIVRGVATGLLLVLGACFLVPSLTSHSMRLLCPLRFLCGAQDHSISGARGRGGVVQVLYRLMLDKAAIQRQIDGHPRFLYGLPDLIKLKVPYSLLFIERGQGGKEGLAVQGNFSGSTCQACLLDSGKLRQRANQARSLGAQAVQGRPPLFEGQQGRAESHHTRPALLHHNPSIVVDYVRQLETFVRASPPMITTLHLHDKSRDFSKPLHPPAVEGARLLCVVWRQASSIRRDQSNLESFLVRLLVQTNLALSFARTYDGPRQKESSHKLLPRPVAELHSIFFSKVFGALFHSTRMQSVRSYGIHNSPCQGRTCVASHSIVALTVSTYLLLHH